MNIKTRMILSAVVIMTLILGATAVNLWIDYLRTNRQVEETVTDITHVVERHIHNTVSQVDALLSEVAKTVVRDGGTEKMLEPERHARLNAFCRSITGCAMIGVADAAGTAIAVSGVPGTPGFRVDDRAFFQGAIRTGKLYIAPAVVSRVPGKPIVFYISKPVYDSNGKLLAIVAAGMYADHFASFYSLMGFTFAPTISVFKRNGDLVARNPGLQEHVGKSNATGTLFSKHLPKAPAGVIESVSGLDGKTRIAAYKTIPAFELVVFAGIEQPVAFQSWRSRALVTGALVGVLIILLLAMLFYTYKSLAAQIRLHAHNKVLDELSYMDGLTGLANRRRFDERLKRSWARHCRSSDAISLLMIDIDHFKRFNDTYGHQEGDVCLQAVAACLRTCVRREVDLVARYGGEEFAVILPCDAQGAMKIAADMRSAVELQNIANAGSPVSPFVTVSIGVASTSAHEVSDEDHLLKMADAALYLAKRQGGNRVIAAPQDVGLKIAVNN